MRKYVYDSKIGPIGIFEEKELIVKILFNQKSSLEDKKTDLIQKTIRQIEEYLSGSKISIEIPYKVTGSDFQRKILSVISQIPYGEKWSYSKVAKVAGFSGASRAVGTVCSHNLLPIVIPCHRVVKADGSFGQYLGGKKLKEHLLKMESLL